MSKSTLRKTWVACLAVGACTLGISSCSDEYDDSGIRSDIENLENRVTTLEEWQKSVNTDIQSLQTLVEALESKNFITDVTPVVEGGEETGYTITFQSGESITIKHGTDGKDGVDGVNGTDGKDGATPVIGVAQDTNGTYYWTLNGEFLTDDSGNKMPVTGPKGDKGDQGTPGTPGADGEDGQDGADGQDGEDGQDAIAPQVRINKDTNEWEISTDGGKTWTSTGVKATGPKGDKGDKGDTGATGAPGAAGAAGSDGDDGDSMFSSVDASDPDKVTFTLADGTTTIVVPRVKELTIQFADGNDVFSVTPDSKTIEVTFTGLKEENYHALMAELKSEDGSAATDIVTRADGAKDVVVAEPVFANGECTSTQITINKTGKSGEEAMLKVTLVDNNGQEVSVSRVVKFYGSELAAIAQTGGSYTLPDNLVIDEEIEVPAGKTLELDLNGKTISNTEGIFDESSQDWSAISVQGGTLIVKNGTIDTKDDDCYAFDVRDGGTLVIESGTYVGNIHAVYVFDGKVEIKGGTFSVVQKYPGEYPYEYVINCYDANYKNGTASVSITGGQFVGFNPANCRAEDEGTNFLAEGYYSKVVREENGMKTYEVAPIENITSADDFSAAIQAEASDIVLGSTVELTSTVLNLAQKQNIDLNGNTLKVQGIGAIKDHSDITFSNGTIELTDGSKNISLYSNSHMLFDNVTLNTKGTAIVCGFQSEADKEKAKNNVLTIKNSTINSEDVGILIQNNGHEVVIENSTINHKWFGITQNGVIPGSSIKLVNTNISGTYSGIYLSNYASGAKNTLVVEGGSIHSTDESAIEVKKTDITVKNATLSSDATTQSYAVKGDGSNGIGYGIVLAGYVDGTAYEGETHFENLTFDLAARADAVKILKYNGTAGEAVDVE